MKEGDVVLSALRQADGQTKHRPSVVLRVMPRYGDLLVCCVSRQIHQEVAGFDQLISPGDPDFVQSGLSGPSLIRLGFLGLRTRGDIVAVIGCISEERHGQLVSRLAEYLTKAGQSQND